MKKFLNKKGLWMVSGLLVLVVGVSAVMNFANDSTEVVSSKAESQTEKVAQNSVEKDTNKPEVINDEKQVKEEATEEVKEDNESKENDEAVSAQSSESEKDVTTEKTPKEKGEPSVSNSQSNHSNKSTNSNNNDKIYNDGKEKIVDTPIGKAIEFEITNVQ